MKIKIIFIKLSLTAVFLTAVSLTAVTILQPIHPVLAQEATTYPQRQSPYVNDYANVIVDEDEAALQNLLETMWREQGIEMNVLTINSINDYDTADTTIESFATNLFNQWQLGDAQRNDGVLLLVAVQDRQLRIELGDGYGRSYDQAAQRIIDNDIIPQFRNGEFGLGTLDGAEALVAELRAPSSPPAPSSSTQNNPESSYTFTRTTAGPPFLSQILGWILGLGTLLGAGGGLGLWLFRPRKCPHCETEMALLGEIEEDDHLSEGEQLEERLGSVKHDVWECPTCQHREKRGSNAIFSSYKGCPQCRHRTVQVRSTTIKHPTYTSTGTRRTTYDCQYCDYEDVRTSTIPRKERSESSSSSSSSSRSRSSSRSSSRSGGRSSGGGASGSW